MTTKEIKAAALPVLVVYLSSRNGVVPGDRRTIVNRGSDNVRYFRRFVTGSAFARARKLSMSKKRSQYSGSSRVGSRSRLRVRARPH